MSDGNGKKSLPALIQESASLIGAIIDGGGEITPEIESALAEVEANLAVKTDKYAVLLDRLEMEASYFKAKADELKNIERALKMTAERLKNMVRYGIQQLGVSELAGQEYKFRLQRTQPKLVIDEAELPAQFKIQITSWEPNKMALREVLSSGLEVPGAKLEESYALKRVVNKAVKS